jgi:heat-inducible transcriptional repressor
VTAIRVPESVAMSTPAIPGRLTPSDPQLSERQRHVFARLVALHRRDARPVSSDRLGRAAELRRSGASLRGTLAELEELRLLERPRAGGGRVPSPSGWEYFVRAVLEPAAIPAEVEDAVAERLRQSRHDVERLLHEASRLLASFSHQLGLALAASLEDEALVSLELETLGERRALLVLGLAGHRSRTLVLELDTPLDLQALEEVSKVLREHLLGGTLADARERLAADPALARHSAVRIVARAAAASWRRPVETPLLTAGVSHIAEQPEFADGSRLTPVLRALESGSPFERLMVSGLQGHAGVSVGFSVERGLAGLSLVSFPLPGAVSGGVGVLGPLRMDYATTIALVDLVGTHVADLLSA